MRLTRNTTPDGKCKYAIVRLDKIREFPQTSIRTPDIQHALALLEMHGVLEYGEPGSEEECFVIKLKDRHAEGALRAYAWDVIVGVKDADFEYGYDVTELAVRARKHPSRKLPD